MALGARTLDLDWDPERAGELLRGRIVQIYKGETLADAWIITARDPRQDGITITGVAPDWLLGLESEGPLITDTEYLAGNERLFNPDFALDDLYYRLAENTGWAIGSTATVDDNPTEDDTLESDQTFDVIPGQPWIANLSARRLSGTIGRLRLRWLFSGRFNHVEKLPIFHSDNWEDVSTAVDGFAGDAVVHDGFITLGPCTPKQLVANPGFETGDLSGWTDSSGVTVDTTYVHTGVQGTHSDEFGGFLVLQIPVTPGEPYRIEGWTTIFEISATAAEASGTVLAYGTGDIVGAGPFEQTGQVDMSWEELDVSIFRRLQADYTIPDAATSFWLQLTYFGVDDQHVHAWDDITMTRLKGNLCAAQMLFSGDVISGRTYEGSIQLEPGAGFVSGSVKLVASFNADGRDSINAELFSIDLHPGQIEVASISMRAPSGYDTFYCRLVGVDILGDSVRAIIGQQVRDSDPSTRIVEDKSPETAAGYVDVGRDLDIVDGAEQLRLQIVAEQGAIGWEARAVSLKRSVDDPVTVAEIATALLDDLDTSNPLLNAGTIHGDDVIAFDWHVVNQHNRDALRHLLEGGVAASLREYRANPDLTVDVGTAVELFDDRTDLIFTDADIDVLVAPSVVEDATNRATHIKVIGATRKRAGGQDFTITATAVVPWDDEMVDAFGEPLHRVRVVENSTINHPDYAAAYATFLATQEAARPKATTLRLSSDRARGAGVKPGQWIYVYSLEAGLEDTDYERQSEDGKVVFPERLRVLSVTERYGEGDCTAYLRRPDGTTVLLDGVRWEDQNEIEVQLGAYVPDFVVNDQGGAAFRQFLRYRASALR